MVKGRRPLHYLLITLRKAITVSDCKLDFLSSSSSKDWLIWFLLSYGFQDTLLAQTGNQVYANCLIQGAVDFVFGQHARVWITKSVIAVTEGGHYITANGRDSSSDPSYYVIDNSAVQAASGFSVAAGSVYLGRPWREYARVCFQRCSLSSIINSAGWTVWSSSTPNTGHVTFQEYGNTGSGASGNRASFATKISAPLTIASIVGSDYTSWVDTSYL